MDRIDIRLLPADIRAKLAELDLELSEGDITQKGYDKKRQKLLAPYVPAAAAAEPPAAEPAGAQQVGFQSQFSMRNRFSLQAYC